MAYNNVIPGHLVGDEDFMHELVHAYGYVCKREDCDRNSSPDDEQENDGK